MSSYLEFKFSGCHNHRDILVAFLQDIDFDGFDESTDGELSAYISKEQFSEEGLKQMLTRLPEKLSYSYEKLADKNWNQVWESNFEPIVIDDYCLIKADFHLQEFDVKHSITINPKQTFGTGHHETTYMMIQQMRLLNFSDKQVCDIGTGTGILAILAEKEGAKHILATENDPKAIINARENVIVNECKHVQIEDHNYSLSSNFSDIILANINMNVLFDYSPVIKLVVKPGGTILLSGILESQCASVIKEYTRDNILRKKAVKQKGEWCLVELEKI